MIPLDVNDPSTVACHSEISIDFGTPNRKTLVCSGIAIPEWSVHDDGTIYRETAVLNLRQTVLAVEQYTIAVGLASIGNGKTNFQFATDATNLQIDPDSGYLMLGVDMALMGDPSALDRFSYQVVAVVTTQTTGISGTIRWSKSLFDASTLSATEVAQLFRFQPAHPPHSYLRRAWMSSEARRIRRVPTASRRGSRATQTTSFCRTTYPGRRTMSTSSSSCRRLHRLTRAVKTPSLKRPARRRSS